MRYTPKHCSQRIGQKNSERNEKGENIETPDDFSRKVELKADYEIDISKSSYEDWLKIKFSK